MFDIKNFPDLLKNILSVAILMPFWYIAIYIYCPELYYQNDLILTISVCIALSIISCLIIGTAFIEKGGILDIKVVFPTIILNIFILSIWIFIGYVFNYFFDSIFSFLGFVATYFSLTLVVSGYFISEPIKAIKRESAEENNERIE